jgi:ABC-type branched-subunit amino acid transport system permease subunit/ABC-type branched-subunit amino acid transport system ATPase component
VVKAIGWIGVVLFILFLGQFMSPYLMSFLMEMLIWSIFAISFNILFGYAGLLSFGQSLFFGMGCYTFALSLIYWHTSIFSSFLLTIIISIIVASITGIFIIRVVSHYFVIMSVLFSLIPFYLANHYSSLTGGDDGIPVPLPDNFIKGFDFSPYNANHMFVFVSIFVLILFFLSKKFLDSPVGLILKGIRENELRAEFMGFRYLAWIISGTLAGLSGSLYVLAFKYTSSSFFHWTLSGEAIVWTIAGGKGTFLGPIVGTLSFMFIKDKLSSAVDYYPIIVGVLLIILVRFRSEGIMGLFTGSINKMLLRFPSNIKTLKYENLQPNFLTNNQLIDNQIILSTNDLGVSFDGVKAVKNITFSLKNDEVKIKVNTPNGVDLHIAKSNDNQYPCLSFIGPNGAGKTTFFNILSGVYTNVNGSMKLFEEDIFNDVKELSKLQFSKYEIVEKGLIRTFQQVQLFPKLTVEENLQIAVQYRINKWAMIENENDVFVRQQEVENILLMTNLTEERKKMANELSYGRQKMLEIGLLLALKGKILLLDEPTAGVSPNEINLIVDLLINLSNHFTLLIIEHDLEVVKKLGFTTCVMADGEIIAAGKPEKVLEISYVKEKFYES